MGFQKSLGYVVVLRARQRAGGIYERSARLNIKRGVVENSALNFRKLLKLGGVLVLYLGLSSDNAKTRAGHVAKHPVRLGDTVVADTGVVLHRLDNPYPEPLRTAADKSDARVVQIHTDNPPAVKHKLRHSEGFSAGRRAHIKHGFVHYRS